MMRLARMAAAVGLALALATPAAAELRFFEAALTGDQEVPPRATPATGSAFAILDNTNNRLIISLSFTDLLGPQVGAHIHGPATPDASAPVLIPLPLGTFTNHVINLPPTIGAFTRKEFKGFLNDGLLYVNVHSQVFPAGEIRGHLINVVPEPGVSALACGMGLAGLWALRRRLVRLR